MEIVELQIFILVTKNHGKLDQNFLRFGTCQLCNSNILKIDSYNEYIIFCRKRPNDRSILKILVDAGSNNSCTDTIKTTNSYNNNDSYYINDNDSYI